MNSTTPSKIETSTLVEGETKATLVVALANLTDAFLSRHGSFPLDKTTDDERHWNRAMLKAYELVGQPNTEARRAAIAKALTP